MNDADRPAGLTLSQSDEPPGGLWTLGELATEEDRAAAELAAGGLTSVGYIRAALRRGAWLWCTTAVIGLLAGFGALKAFPRPYQASTEILLSTNLPGPPGQAVQDDQAIAQSHAVAGAALRMLKLPESPASFVGDYTATVLTSRVFAITAKAASGAEAVREANALATAFLTFQANQLKSQEKLVGSSLDQQVTQAQQHIRAIGTQIAQVAAQPSSPAQQARLASLVTERNQAKSELTVLKQSSLGSQAAARIAATTQIKGSQVLDRAALLPQHAKKYLLLYAGGGLIVGLVAGLIIVIVRALVSDRLWRRDEVARALGAPVKLSVGPLGPGRLRSALRWLAAARRADVDPGRPEIQRIAAHLRQAVPDGSRRSRRSKDAAAAASLAVIPVDDVQVPAACLVALATSCAQQGLQVLVADLCAGAPAARLLGVTEPGIELARAPDAPVVVAVPDRDEIAPHGPRGLASALAGPDAGKLSTAFAAAEVTLTLAALDPSVGGEHLATWADAAVAVVTAGQSSAEQIHGNAEMIRLAGVELISAVLVGADRADKSLGVPPEPASLTPAGLGPESLTP